MISRDWRCLNPRCAKIFHSYEKANPPCDHCGCVKVAWIPGGGHIGTKAAAVDQTVRSLAHSYQMPNINTPSHSRLNRSMPKFEQPKADMPARHWGMGFSSVYSSSGSICTEAGAAVGGKVTTNRTLPASRSFLSPTDGRFTMITHIHKGAA